MHFLGFRIQNFKGIIDTTIDFPFGVSAVTTLVGLNESGKTTLLEAISEFSKCMNEDSLTPIIPKFLDKKLTQYIPKSTLGNFSDTIEITAYVHLSKAEIKEVETHLNSNFSDIYRINLLPEKYRGENHFTITRRLIFKDSVHISTENKWTAILEWKETNKHKKWQKVYSTSGKAKQWAEAAKYIKDNFLPSIAYYPTAYFDFPERINLIQKVGEGKEQQFYRGIVQQILDACGKDYELEKHITSRIVSNGKLSEEYANGSLAQQMVQTVTHGMESVLTQLIFKSWNEIFGKTSKQREIKLSVHYSEGSENCIPYLKLDILQDGNFFPLSDRSLGFRWFFSFLLFTVFKKPSKAGTIFLIDEPASNLHATAQSKLMDKFRLICGEKNSIIYSTHSHHMINPAWLEFSYIISNDGVDYSDYKIDEIDSQTAIKATKVKRFLSEHPDKNTYYQPILERLGYVKSGFELGAKAIIVEGKTDFLVLRYFRDIIFPEKANNYSIIPGTGCGSLSSLISLHSGWGVNFLVFLDSDSEGILSAAKYKTTHFLDDTKVKNYDSVFGKGKIERLEDIFSEPDILLIKDGSKKKLKSSIPHFFSNIHFKGEVPNFSSETIEKFGLLLDTFESSLGANI